MQRANTVIAVASNEIFIRSAINPSSWKVSSETHESCRTRSPMADEIIGARRSACG